MTTIFFVLCFCCLLFVTVKGATVNGKGCPEGRKIGESWSFGSCGKCRCYGDRHGCSTCGVYALEYDKTNCYDYRDQSAEYPTCCNPIVKCRGDEGFDESFLVG